MRTSPKQRILSLLKIKESESKWSENAASYKSQLLDQILPYLDRAESESESEAKSRLLGEGGKGSLSTGKLLKLYDNAQRLKSEFGGSKDKLVDTLLRVNVGTSGKLDEDFRRHLNKKSVATLLLSYDHAVKAGVIEK